MNLTAAIPVEEITHAKLFLLMDAYLPRAGQNPLWTEITFPARLVPMPLPHANLFGTALTLLKLKSIF